MNLKERNILKNNSMFVLLAALVALIIFSICIYMSFKEKKFIYNESTNFQNKEVKYCIDSKDYDKDTNFIIIKGWAFALGETINIYQCHVVLKDTKTMEYIELLTQLVNRSDVTQAFKNSENEFNYDKSGFKAKININKLKKSLENYEICLYYNNNNSNTFIQTGILLE